MTFSLSGKKASQYELKIQAAFSETGVQKIQGQHCELKSIHQDEFLTGLKIKVSSKSLENQAKRMTVKNKSQQTRKKSSWNDFDDVMMFKS